MRTLSIARLLLGLILSANGIAMLAAPETWYLSVPGVAETGPLNPHFVRDIGCAYLVSGAALLWLARTASAWPAALAGSAFLLLHAGVHRACYELFQGSRLDEKGCSARRGAPLRVPPCASAATRQCALLVQTLRAAPGTGRLRCCRGAAQASLP